MQLYTGKGDNGSSTIYNSKKRVSKDSPRFEALGTIDELNSYIGLIQSLKLARNFHIGKLKLTTLLLNIEETLFIIQAEIGGARIVIQETKVKEIEKIINAIEKEMPPIRSFALPGGDELAAHLDCARTLARRAERKIVTIKTSSTALSYLNRLSSLFYALARYINWKKGIKIVPPSYR